jgi:DNA-binding transcriptional LysR family regulator
MIDDALLPLLPSLIALVEEQGVTRASARLGVSQPRLSARLSDLRRLLRDDLLVPAAGRRGVVPTTRAIELAAAAREALRQLDTTVSGFTFDPRSASRTFKIMANDNASIIIGARLIDAIRAASGPDVRVVLLNYDPTRLRTLELGELDLVLASPGQLAVLPSLISRTVVRDRFMTASAVGLSEAGIGLDAFCARDHIVVSTTGGGFESLIDEELERLGRSRRVAVSVQSYLVAIELVATSDLVATLPHTLLAHRASDITAFEPPIMLSPFALSAGWHMRSTNDPAHRWLRDRCFAAAGLGLSNPAGRDSG